MATEILAIPEENLEEFITILQLGMQNFIADKRLSDRLNHWINEELEYLRDTESSNDVS